MKLAALAVVLAPALAHAEPPAPIPVQATTYMQADLMLGGAAPVAGPNLMFGFELGHQLIDGLWARGELAVGAAADDQGGGGNDQGRAGLEARSCSEHDRVCGFASADLGYQRGTWHAHGDSMHHEQVDAVVVVPRLGFEVGSARVHFLFAFELDTALWGRHQVALDTGMTSEPVQGLMGGELVSGVRVAW